MISTLIEIVRCLTIYILQTMQQLFVVFFPQVEKQVKLKTQSTKFFRSNLEIFLLQTTGHNYNGSETLQEDIVLAI